MAGLGDLISAKNESDKAWREQRESDRQLADGVRDAGVVTVLQSSERYAEYLTLQGDNPQYSAGNIILCQFQLNEPTIIGTEEKWRQDGRRILETERDNGAKIFIRPKNKNIKGYTLGTAYDISQTSGRDIERTKIDPHSEQMKKAVAALLNFSNVEIVADNKLENIPAYYDEKNIVLYVNPESEYAEAFPVLATEIQLARQHQRGYNKNYNREICYLAADSVSYMICRRYGIERDLPDTSNIAAIYGGATTTQATETLNYLQSEAKYIGGSIEKQIAPPQRAQSHIPVRPRR